MLYTSAEANKLLREKNDAYKMLLKKEEMSCSFVVTIQEDPETLRPEYDYRQTQQELQKLAAEIRMIKHAINTFNLETVIPEFDMTIDQMLVYIPQLTAAKNKYDRMRSRLPKQRVKTDRFMPSSNFVEYDYANYQVADAETDYDRVAKELAKAQTALDVVNNSVQFEIEL